MAYKNIKSKYVIKEYIDEEIVNMLNVNTDATIEHFTLDTTDIVSHRLLEQWNEQELNDKMTQKKTLKDIINFKVSIQEPNKAHIMHILSEALFIPFTIIKWIELNCSHGIKISWDNVIIRIYDNEVIGDEIYNHVIKIVKWLINISKQNKPKINLYIYLTDFKKYISNDILGNMEINSGVSYTNHWLQIFRKEEILKVLIHELIHNLNLDVNYSSFCKGCSDNINMHENSQPILINEGYVEAIALYLHCIYCGIETNTDPWQLLRNEEQFTIYQINKIFRHYKIHNINYFSTSNNFVQHTNVIPYFILKYLFLLNIKYFIKCFYDKDKTEALVKRSMNKLYKLKIPKVRVVDSSLKMSITSII